MKNSFIFSIVFVLLILTSCSYPRFDENLTEESNSISLSPEVSTTTESISETITETTSTTIIDDRAYVSIGDLREAAESSNCIIYKKDLDLSELPNFDISYLDAKLPDSIQSNLSLYHTCFLKFDEFHIYTFRRNLYEEYCSFTSFDGYTFIEPKLYYDNGQLYILAKESHLGHLFKISLDDAYAVQDTFLYADVPQLDNFKVISYLPNQKATFVQKDDGSYAFYKLGVNICNLDINAKPEDIIFNKPFIDNDNNLIFIVADEISKSIQYYVDTDVCNLYDDYIFFNIDYGNSFLYEKCDGSAYLLSYSLYTDQINIAEIELTDFMQSLHFEVDELNRCFIRTERVIESQVKGMSESFTLVLGEYVCDIPMEKLETHELNELLDSKFSYSEKDSRIEELLEYINN